MELLTLLRSSLDSPVSIFFTFCNIKNSPKFLEITIIKNVSVKRLLVCSTRLTFHNKMNSLSLDTDMTRETTTQVHIAREFLCLCANTDSSPRDFQPSSIYVFNFAGFIM